jgi:hypothetical protein
MDFQLRKVERMGEHGWALTTFASLKKGESFRLSDEGAPNGIEDGTTAYVAASDPVPVEPEGNYGIEIETQG